MLEDLNDKDRTERDAIVADIHAAFAGVARGQYGISWNECYALDNYEPAEVCEAARRSDSDTQWTELIADPNWEPFPGLGGFSFINAEGFRYYLPPTMIRFLGGDITEWYPGHLIGVIERFIDPHAPQLWSEPQLRCIARFVEFMARHDGESFRIPGEPNAWDQALRRRWHTHLPK